MALGRSLAFQLRQNHLAQFQVVKETLEELLERWRPRIGSFDSGAEVDAAEVTSTQSAGVFEAITHKEAVPEEQIERLRQSVRDSSGERVLPGNRSARSIDRPYRSSTESPIRIERLTRVEQLSASEIADSMISNRAQRIREAVRNGSIQRAQTAQTAAQGRGFNSDVPARCEQQANALPVVRLSHEGPLPLRSAVSTACRVQAESSAADQSAQDK
jgi:hypothetical protein